MASHLAYYRTAERPDIAMWILDDDGDLIDFSTGYTFAWKLGSPGAAASFTKTTLITGAAGAGVEATGTPNILIQFVAAELDDVDPGSYTWQLTATSSSLSRVYQGRITILDVIT
jgi:hypothetical protein